MNEKKVDMNEIRRLQKAARDGNKQKLIDWFLQFDEQVRNEYQKNAEEVIENVSNQLRKHYKEIFRKELADSIDNYIIAITYTLKFSELTKFGAKRIKEFMEDMASTINMFSTGEYTPDEYKKILKDNGIELFTEKKEVDE